MFVISFLKNFFKQLKKSRWIQVYFVLVIIQVVLSIPILFKTLVNTENVALSVESGQQDENSNLIFGADLAVKGYKVIYENSLFIAFEAWRLWVLIDGIAHQNSLTILASAWFSLISGFFNILLIVESRKWMRDYYDPLKLENMYLQIVLTIVLFLLSIPVIYSAHKSVKVIGWQVYKRIGSSIELQQMFYKVQWLEFWLKVDIFFELVLIVFVAAITTNLVFRILCIIMAFFIAIGLVMARIAISYESQWMMFGFLFLQLLLFLCNVYSLFGLFLYSDKWFTGIIFEFVSIICIVVTVYFCILCQINFGKGLKSFVYWFPFRSNKNGKLNGAHNSLDAELLRNRGGRQPLPIDDEEDDEEEIILTPSEKRRSLFSYQFTDNSEPQYRTSLERVYSELYNDKIETNGRDKIKLITKEPQNRVVMQPIQTSLPPLRTSSSSPRAFYSPSLREDDTFSFNSTLLESNISESNARTSSYPRPIMLESNISETRSSPRPIVLESNISSNVQGRSSPHVTKTTITTTVVTEFNHSS